MALNATYQRQVSLLIRILPTIAEEACFALKGGTAINLFIRDMPRLSVDVDLTYLPVASRAESLDAIDAAMKRIAQRIRAMLRGVQIATSATNPEKAVIKLIIRHDNAQVKIEVTPVLRGCVYEPEIRSVSASVEDAYGFAEIRVVSFADLYAGKIVAALDRQHPRDLFDVRDLLCREGIDDNLRRAFLIYLISHNRPMAEILAPTRKNIENEFSLGFAGMTAEAVPLEALLQAREALIASIVGQMPQVHQDFLIGFERGATDWKALDRAGAEDLPAVRWRQQNLNGLSAGQRANLVAQLERVLPERDSSTAAG